MKIKKDKNIPLTRDENYLIYFNLNTMRTLQALRSS